MRNVHGLGTLKYISQERIKIRRKGATLFQHLTLFDTKFGPKSLSIHDDVIKWKHFPRYWPFVRGIPRSSVNSPHKGQWRGALMFSLICARLNGWVNNREAGDLRRHRAHYDVIVMYRQNKSINSWYSIIIRQNMIINLCQCINL